MGLILTQAVSIGIAVAVFDADYWLQLDSPTVNGVTYAMAAFAVQGVAYYLFKMFFQQGMDERARMSSQADFVPAAVVSKDPLSLGLSFGEEDKVRGSDGKFKKKE